MLGIAALAQRALAQLPSASVTGAGDIAIAGRQRRYITKDELDRRLAEQRGFNRQWYKDVKATAQALDEAETRAGQIAEEEAREMALEAAYQGRLALLEADANDATAAREVG